MQLVRHLMRSFKSILKAVRNFLFSGLNKEFLIFLFFLALSGIFWLMMTLNETTEREFNIPVQLTGVPRNAVITGELADTVHITSTLPELDAFCISNNGAGWPVH